GGRPLEGPGAADLADGVVEDDAAVAAVPESPAEGLPVEGRGDGDVEGWDFDVADFAVGGSHKGVLADKTTLAVAAGQMKFTVIGRAMCPNKNRGPHVRKFGHGARGMQSGTRGPCGYRPFCGYRLLVATDLWRRGR